MFNEVKIAVVGNGLLLLGFALAGIKTCIRVDTPGEAVERIEEISSSGEYGVVFIAPEIYRQVAGVVEEIQGRRPIPILIEVPGMEGKRINGDE